MSMNSERMSISSANFNEINSKDKDNVFEQLKDLQTLIKKESALKELFIKTSNETKKNIEEQCKEMYKKKLDFFYNLNKLKKKKDSEVIKYQLIEDPINILKDLNNYIPKLLIYLWEEPKVMAKLIQNSQISDIKNSLAPMLANNFYENILSFNYLQDNFLYVISILIKDEITNLKSTNDLQIFLQDTPCGCILDHLINKIDIQSYFKALLQDIIENIDKNCSNRVMNFHLKEIEKQILNKKNKKDKKEKKDKKDKKTTKELEDVDIYRRENFTTDPNPVGHLSTLSTSFDEEENYKGTYDKFCTNYIPDVEPKVLYEKMQEYDDIKMKKYFEFQLNNCKEKSDLYANKSLLNMVFQSAYSTKILFIYHSYFMKVMKIIETIFNKLLNDIQSLPYSVKCICRIISVLIRKKFPGITAIEENAFIAKFFFCKLFAPIFRNPSAYCLINEFIISNKTKENLDIITPIILQLVSGRLYKQGGEHGEFTPFNWFFMQEMPFVLKFFNHITKVKLPTFLEKFIHDKLEDNFVYDYFRENPDEVIFHRSICFNIYDICSLLNNIKNCKDIIFKDCINKGMEKACEKIFSIKKNETLLKDLKGWQDSLIKNNPNNSMSMSLKYKSLTKGLPINKDGDNSNVIYYYLVQDLLCNPNYKIFNLVQKTPHFCLKELKETENEEEVTLNNIIKVKNFFSSLLCNYRNLMREDFDITSKLNVTTILKELKNFTKTQNFVIDGSIPSEWYVTSLMKYLNKIPSDLTNNDCEKLFESMKIDLNKSIQELDFETLSYCLNKIKFVHKGIVYYEQTKEIIIDIILNTKVQKIIEEEKIKVEIEFEYGKKKKFKIKLNSKEKNLQLLDNLIFVQDKKRQRIAKTIEDFSKIFPNFAEYQMQQDLDIFEMQNELEVPKQLNEYFDYIKEHIKKNKNFSDEKLSNIMYEKIYDYVMGKIYDKIFPMETDKKDDLIYNNCIILSWVEPHHFVPGKKNYEFEGFLPDVIKNYDLLDKMKSPRQKLKSMSNIFSSIVNLLKFNTGDNNAGVDDQIPILNYSFIRANPSKIYSNCRFMDLYIGDLKYKREGNQLTQLFIVCERLCDISYESLINVKKEEFDKKCADSRQGNYNEADFEDKNEIFWE